MAPQPVAALPHRGGVLKNSAPEGWRAFHLVYHAGLDPVLRGLVRPLAASLLAEGAAESFFFIRYPLGGPHVRLRVLPRPGRGERVAEAVRAAAEGFFALHPSPAPLPEEKVRRDNRAVIPGDPFATEADDVVLPDNSLHEHPVGFEVERYGGAALFPRSLDFFALSSLDALAWLARHAEVPPTRRLPEAGRVLLRQAWGFAEDPDSFLALAEYGVTYQGKAMPRLVEHGDAAWESGREGLRALVRAELAALASPEADADPERAIAQAARALAEELRGAEPARRREVAMSQMHMSANRLGLMNPEEVYLTRMLHRAATNLADSDPAFWAEAWDARRALPPPPPLRDLARGALEAFARTT